MTYEEIRASIPSLTKEEREELTLDLRALALLDDPEYRAEIGRLMDEAEAGTGKAFTEIQLRDILAARQRTAA